MREYMAGAYSVVDSCVAEDFSAGLLKAYAWRCGAYLAFLRMSGADVGEWDKELREGI